jgi:hypothetical protein
MPEGMSPGAWALLILFACLAVVAVVWAFRVIRRLGKEARVCWTSQATLEGYTRSVENKMMDLEATVERHLRWNGKNYEVVLESLDQFKSGEYAFLPKETSDLCPVTGDTEEHHLAYITKDEAKWLKKEFKGLGKAGEHTQGVKCYPKTSPPPRQKTSQMRRAV